MAVVSANHLSRVRQAAYRGFSDRVHGVRDDQGYLVDVTDNFLPGVPLALVNDDFQDAAGKELEGKMRAPWSSAALAVNVFSPWRNDPSSFELAGGQGFRTLRFERTCPTGLRGTPPHLDVLAVGDDSVVAIESKCTETLSVKAPKFKAAYDSIADQRRASKWFGLIGLMRSEQKRFQLLDAAQLVKHYLGLSNCFPGRHVKLIYLYWEPVDAGEIDAYLTHRNELEDFGNLVDGGDDWVQFLAMPYARAWERFPANEHLAAVRERYSFELAPYLT